MTDLRSRLHDVVDVPEPLEGRPDRGATAHDDVVVGALTTRVRRRRTVRAGALGAVGALTVAAIAVGGAAVADRLQARPAPPAGTEEPEPEVSPGLMLGCGDWFSPESIRPTDSGMGIAALELGSGVVPAGTALNVTLRLSNDGDARHSWDTEQTVDLAVLRDGTIVGTATLSVSSGEYGPGSAMTTSQPVFVSPCAPDEALPAGDYELVASAVLANSDGSALVVLSQGPVPFTVTSAEAPTEADETAAEDAVRRYVEAATTGPSRQPVGTCGTVLPTDADPLLQLEMTLAGSTFAPGALIEGDAAISARDGLSVLANGPITSVHVVLVRDGVVVGRGDYDPEYVDLMTFTDRAAYPLPAYANAIVCAAPGATPTGLGLPPGTYQAYGLYEVALKEVQQADGTAQPRSDTVTIVSDPVDVVIDGSVG